MPSTFQFLEIVIEHKTAHESVLDGNTFCSPNMGIFARKKGTTGANKESTKRERKFKWKFANKILVDS